jgi:hypothetical protein
MAVTPAAERLKSEYLERLSQRFRAWRLREGKSYFSMPTPLWDEAIAAARDVGLRKASRLLGLNRDELKRRMELAPEVNTDTTPQAAEEPLEVIELPGVARALMMPSPTTECERPALLDTERADAAGSSTDAMIKVIATDGSRLTVHFPADRLNIASLVPLVHEFRSRA